MQKPCACGCGQLTQSQFVRGHHWKTRAAAAVIEPPNPGGLCMCGCGRPTPIATVTIHAQRKLKGFPVRFFPHHGYVKHRGVKGPNPSGICMCGCGERTAIAKYTNPKKGAVKGEPMAYIHNHKQTAGRKRPEDGYTIEDRGFDSPCWIWLRSRDKHGYGYFGNGGRRLLAHRYFYLTFRGPLSGGLEVHHRCHVTSCVNPDHLEAVTSLINNREKKIKRLTMEKARVIRQLHWWGASIASIARTFKVTAPTISAVVHERIWNEEAAEAAPKLLILNY